MEDICCFLALTILDGSWLKTPLGITDPGLNRPFHFFFKQLSASFSVYSKIFTFCINIKILQKRTTLEAEKSMWYSEFQIFRSVSLYKTFINRWSWCLLQGESCAQAGYQLYKCLGMKLYKPSDTFKMCTSVNNSTYYYSCHTHGTVLQLAQRRKNCAINCIWTIISPHQHHLMTCIAE